MTYSAYRKWKLGGKKTPKAWKTAVFDLLKIQTQVLEKLETTPLPDPKGKK